MEPDKLRRFKEYGESVLQKLDSVPMRPSLQENWVPASLDGCLDRLRDAANKTVEQASSPVKIGVMGEFSAGKTLLLGSLIGYADALPVSANPTTGNVTAIHIAQQDGLHTTQVHAFKVEYLDRQGVKDCLRFMLEEAEKRAVAAQLPSQQLAALKSLNPQDAGVWDGLLSFCEGAWNSSKNLELRYLLRELVLFARTYNTYEAAITGKSYEIDAATAREGLQLADAATDIQNLSFNSLPPAPPRLQNPPKDLTAWLLKNTFPLIRRIEVWVKVSKEIWDLSAVKGVNEFVLLDFPGLGAANSGVRDTFLSLRELEEVQTILILLNAQSPGGDRANRIFTMMQQRKPGQDLKDRILVGVGRFDELPLQNEGGEKILDELIGEDGYFDDILQLGGEPVTEESVLEKLRVLKTTLAGAQAFTNQKDRIVLLSPLLGLADLAKRAGAVRAGSPEFLANLDYPGYLDQSKRLRQKWGKLSERLQESDSRSTLGRQLGYFAQDGGIGRLRELLQKHVADHGLKQLYEDTRRAAGALRQQQESLKNIVEQIHQQGIPTAETPGFNTLRQSIDSLLKTYREFQNNLGKKPLQNRQGVAVTEVVRDELTFRMSQWNKWNLLFQNTENGIIRLPKSTSLIDEIFRDLDAAEEIGIPTKSDDFYPPFETTVRELEKFARDRVREAVADLLSGLSHKVREERTNLEEILPAEKQKPLFAQLREANTNIRPLQILVGGAKQPQIWQEGIFRKCELQENSPPTINPEIIFPLARTDSRRSGQTFEWGRDSQTQTQPRPFNHLMLVLRLQNEMIASARQQLVQYVSERNQLLNSMLGELLSEIINNLQALLQNEALLRTVAAEDGEARGSAPSWLKSLSHIASISDSEPT
ncbi:dynamin family protein [Kamptonema formosum]|uniref:dynamin family protein n=1 Tax=Kamptonema formosum TaxID=331992 RepID=UPI000344ECF4|nr:dynamin family protein [Oscillatoria sp. PCC 10802]